MSNVVPTFITFLQMFAVYAYYVERLCRLLLIAVANLLLDAFWLMFGEGGRCLQQ